jgi:hypothetical protein
MKNKSDAINAVGVNPLETVSVEIVPRGYLHISFLQPLRERQRSKGISRSKTLVVIV